MKNLKEAKVGDVVIIESQFRKTLTLVDSITKAGNIKTKNGQIFYPNGKSRGSSSPWYPDSAFIASEEDVKALKKEIRVKKITSRCLNTHIDTWQRMSLEDLELINNILDKKPK